MPQQTNAELRTELKAAISSVRQQIAVQSTADHYLGSENITANALSELRSELANLEDALAGLP